MLEIVVCDDDIADLECAVTVSYTHLDVYKRQACMFWDNNGNKTLSYNPESRNWKAISTEEEFEMCIRDRVLILFIVTIVNITQMSKLKKKYKKFMSGKDARTLEDVLKRCV